MGTESHTLELPDFLSLDPYGEILVAGHRIGLLHVVQDFQEGYSPEMIAGQYPTLPLGLVYKVIGFYLENRDDVDAYVRQCQAEIARQAAAGPSLDVGPLRQRLEQRAAASRP